MIAGLVRSELLKVRSTRTWWGVLVPVVLLGLLTGLFAGVFAEAGPAFGEDEAAPYLVAAAAYTLTLAAQFAAVLTGLGAAGEFRHRTITTTYLTAPGRGAVLVAKLVVAALVGVGYAVAALVAVVVGALVRQGFGALTDLAGLLTVGPVGIAVVVLWSCIGVALGIALTNQAGTVVLLLLYVLLGELLLSTVLNLADALAIRQITAYLPVNAGEVALYTAAGDAVFGADPEEIVALAAGVTDPLPVGWSLLVLTAWALALCVLAWWVGNRRDIA